MVLSFEEALRLGTGLEQDHDKWRETANNRARVKNQTDIISARLAREGIDTWNAPHDPVTIIGELSGRIEQECQKRRHIMILPEVAQVERSGLIRDLTYFIENHPKGRFVRYGVITGGPRLPLGGDLRKLRKKIHKNMTRWVSEARQNYDIEVIFRGDEYTFQLNELLKSGSVHFHVNVAYIPHRKLPRDEWAQFLSWTKRRIGGFHWKDCGKLNDVRELVKYICKLGTGTNDKTGSVGIDQLSSPDLSWFHRQIFNAQNVGCMGSFAAFRAGLERDGQKIAFIRGALRRVQKCKAKHHRNRREEQVARGERGKVENLVLSRQLPNRRFGPVAEPCLLVMGYNPMPTTGKGAKGLAFIESCKAQSMDWARENNPDLFNVHIGTIITQPSEPTKEEKIYPRAVVAPATARRMGYIICNGQKVPRFRHTQKANSDKPKPITRQKRIVINNGQRVEIGAGFSIAS